MGISSYVHKQERNHSFGIKLDLNCAKNWTFKSTPYECVIPLLWRLSKGVWMTIYHITYMG